MSSSVHIDNKKKDILILGKNPTQALEHTLTAEKMYSINFTKRNKKFCLSVHYNGANSYLCVNVKEIHKFKTKDSEIVATPLCLGNISKHWSVDDMKKICDSHLTCKVANNCLNVRERVEGVEWNKRWSPFFPCFPVSRQCP